MMEYIGIFLIIFAIIFVCVFCFMILFTPNQEKSVINRAKKIDPSVKTYTEALFVLQKDIAKNFGNNEKDKN